MAKKLSDLTSGEIAELTRLIGQKEKLTGQLQAVDAKIEALEGGKAKGGKPVKTGRTRGGRRGPKKGAKPGAMKAAILSVLPASGGLTIKELAQKLKVKPNNLYSWFYTTGRKVVGLKKAGDKYTYAASDKK